MNRYRTVGVAEFENLTNGETTAECWNNCQKYADHGDFIAASDFNVSHLPLDYRDDSMHRCIKLMSDLTVRLKIRGTDSSSPIAGSSHEDNDTPRVTRMCTGFCSYFDIRSWASVFENNPVLKKGLTLDCAQTADTGEFSDSFLDRIKEQIVSEMDRSETLDVTELPHQDVIDDMAVSRAMFRDEGVSCHDPCTSDNAPNNISDDTTPKIPGDPTTNIAGDSLTNISEDATTNISDNATTNITDDTITNISCDSTSNITHDAASNASDNTTSNISGNSPTNISDDSTTTNVQNPPSSSSYVKADLTRVYPCPCPECKSIPNPQPLGYVFDVIIDTRAILDNEEASNTVVDLELGGEVKHLYGQTVHRVSAFCDLQRLRCVTHELKLAEWIKDTSAAFREVYRKVLTKVLRPLAVICSYPHGHQKMISVGEWIARFIYDCGSTAPLTYVSFRYTTPTCPGSMGAPVLILGKMENYRLVFSEMQSHYGNLHLDGNTSGVGLALAYDA